MEDLLPSLFEKGLQLWNTTSWPKIDPKTLFETDLEKNELVQGILYGSPFPILFALHILNVAVNLKPRLQNQPWTFSAFATILSATSGFTLACLLVFQFPPILASNYLLPTALIIWYLVHFSIGNVVFKIAKLPPIKLILVLGSNINRARSIIDGINLGIKFLPNSWVAAIILGSISGFGGTLILNFLVKTLGEENQLTEISKPTWASKSAFYGSVFYYVAISAYFGTILPESIARFALITYICLHAATTSVVGDFTPFPVNLIEYVFYKVSRIPMEPEPVFISLKELREIDEKERQKQKKKN